MQLGYKVGKSEKHLKFLRRLSLSFSLATKLKDRPHVSSHIWEAGRSHDRSCLAAHDLGCRQRHNPHNEAAHGQEPVLSFC